MDLITQSIYNLNNEVMTTVSLFIDSAFIFGLVIIAIILFGEKKWEKRKKIIVAILIGILVGHGLKQIYHIERPCIELNSKVIDCSDYSFPSLHAITVFILSSAFIRRKEYPLYLLFALFVSFTRIYLGMHSFVDIAASGALAALVYHIVDLVKK